MVLTPPTTPLSLVDFWGSENDWPAIFEKLGRACQRTDYGFAQLVERGDAKELLRIYAELMTHVNLEDPKTVQNLTEFKRGGVINVALNQENKVGLIWNGRSVIHRDKMPAYQAIWDKYAHVPSKGRDEARMFHFLSDVCPLIGMHCAELPRGYSEPTKTQGDSAAKEAEEELLVSCTEVVPLGLLGEDSAQNPAQNTFVFARMDVKGKPKAGRDLWEKIAGRAEWVTLGELYQGVRDGHLVDPYTLAGLEMLKIYKPDAYYSIPLL